MISVRQLLQCALVLFFITHIFAQGEEGALTEPSSGEGSNKEHIVTTSRILDVSSKVSRPTTILNVAITETKRLNYTDGKSAVLEVTTPSERSVKVLASSVTSSTPIIVVTSSVLPSRQTDSLGGINSSFPLASCTTCSVGAGIISSSTQGAFMVTSSVLPSRQTNSLGGINSLLPLASCTTCSVGAGIISSSTQSGFVAANKTSAATSVRLTVSPVISASIPVPTGPYTSSVLPTTAPGSVPTAAPRNVTAHNLTSQSLLVAWRPAPSDTLNGELSRYDVLIKKKTLPTQTPTNSRQFVSSMHAVESKVSVVLPTEPSTESPSEEAGARPVGRNLSVVIDSLEKWTEYEVQVRAVTNAPGPYSDIITVRTDEDLPGTPNDLKAIAINSSAVFVNWTEPSVKNGIILKYQVSYSLNGSQNVGKSDVGLQMSYVVFGLNVFTGYIIKVSAFTSKGKGIDSETNVTTAEGVPGPPVIESVRNISSTTLKITWRLPVDPNGDITGFQLCWSLQEPNNATCVDINKSAREHNISKLVPYSLYTLSLAAKTSVGLGPRRTELHRTDEGVPSQPKNLKASKRSATSISLSWEEPEFINGILKGYQVSYQQDGAQPENVGLTNNYDLHGLRPNTVYWIEVQALTSKGPGDKNVVKEKTDNAEPPPIGTLAPPARPEEDTFEINLHKVPDTNGAISYYQVIVRELATDREDNPIPDSFEPKAYKPDKLVTYEKAQSEKPKLVPYVAAQFPASEFDDYRTFTVGNGGKTRVSASARRRRDVGNDTVYYNGPLEPSTYYTVFQRAYITKVLYTSSGWMDPVQTAGVVTAVTPTSGQIDVGLVVGLSVFIVILLVVIFASFLYLRKKRSDFIGKGFAVDDDGRPYNEDGQPLKKLSRKRRSQQKRLMGSTDSLEALNDLAAQRARRQPVPLDEFERHVERMHMDGDHGFSEEYALVEPGEEFQYQAFLNPANKFKNRYANIVAYDHSRVLLSQTEGVPGSDYINANYIDGYMQPSAFIAAQGPLYETFDDFWRMVWETNSELIVMLTRLEERGRRKCDQYWPDSGMQIYGKIEVTVSEVLRMSHFTLRTFLVTHKLYPEEERIVKQFHYTTWPDHDVPAHPTPLLSLLRRSSSANSDTTGPIIVHCSAGVGRTGTFIALDVMLKRIAHGEPLDVFGFVRQMRTQRNIMVQTEAQYVFIHDALLEAIACGVTEVEAKDLCARIRELNIEDEQSGCTNMEKEFSRLAKEESHPMAFKNASMSCNSTKNRYCNILPFDSSRVHLRMRPGDLGSDYINASVVDGYCQPKAYIATQAPLPNTFDDFWRLIWEQHAASIVMLSKEEEGGKVKCHHYWPSDGSHLHTDILVELIEETAYTDYITRKFKLTQTELKDTRTVRQFQYIDWPDSGMPDSGVGLVDLIGQVQKWQQQSGNNAIVVHCSGGVGRTGVFCAMSVMIERLKAEGLIDVFQTVQAMRLQRPAMVQTKEQYEFCYTTLQEYLDSFDLYANFQ